MVDETDAELVAGVRRGDRSAAGRLADRYLRGCRAVALGMVHDFSAAEDLCQDAFVYAIQRIDDCRDPVRFGGWLFTILRNRCRNHLRDSKADREVSLDVASPRSLGASPEEDAERAEIRDRLVDALATLNEERRTVILLHDLEGWTHSEIAERLDLPPGTVRSHLHYARKSLRPLLESLMERDE